MSLPAAWRTERCDIARWALATGSPATVDALTVIIGSRPIDSGIDGTPPDRWTAHRIVSFLWASIPAWCEIHEVEVPDSLGESLWTYLRFLHATRGLAPGSDSPADLCTALRECAGLDAGGRSPDVAWIGARRRARERRRGTGPTSPVIPLRPPAIDLGEPF